MSKKIALLLASLLCALACIFALTGCNDTTDTTDAAHTEHNFDDDGICTVCGDYMQFTLNSDNSSYSITDYAGTTPKMVIPSEYNGLPVTRIGSSAFHDCNNLIEIIIPESIKSIECNESVTPFEGCVNLHYNSYNTALYLGSKDNPYAFLIKSKHTAITKCTINEDTKVIVDYAFFRCSNLTSVTIPDSVTTIGEKAFYWCGLDRVTIGDSVTNIGEKAFNHIIEVFYKGTEAEWSAIIIEDYWHTSEFTSSERYYYSETEPTGEGNYWHYDTDGKTILKWE